MKLLDPHGLGTRGKLENFTDCYMDGGDLNIVLKRRGLQTILKYNIGMELREDLKSAEWPIRLMW